MNKVASEKIDDIFKEAAFLGAKVEGNIGPVHSKAGQHLFGRKDDEPILDYSIGTKDKQYGFQLAGEKQHFTLKGKDSIVGVRKKEEKKASDELDYMFKEEAITQALDGLRKEAEEKQQNRLADKVRNTASAVAGGIVGSEIGRQLGGTKAIRHKETVEVKNLGKPFAKLELVGYRPAANKATLTRQNLLSAAGLGLAGYGAYKLSKKFDKNKESQITKEAKFGFGNKKQNFHAKGRDEMVVACDGRYASEEIDELFKEAGFGSAVGRTLGGAAIGATLGMEHARAKNEENPGMDSGTATTNGMLGTTGGIAAGALTAGVGGHFAKKGFKAVGSLLKKAPKVATEELDELYHEKVAKTFDDILGESKSTAKKLVKDNKDLINRQIKKRVGQNVTIDDLKGLVKSNTEKKAAMNVPTDEEAKKESNIVPTNADDNGNVVDGSTDNSTQNTPSADTHLKEDTKSKDDDEQI